MNLDQFGPLLVAGGTATIIALVGLWANRKMGLNPATDKLVETLEATMNAQAQRILVQAALMEDRDKRIAYLEQRNRDLEAEIKELKGKYRRRRDV